MAKKARKFNMRPADLRLPPVVAVAAEPSRQKDWPNIVTCHARTGDVHAWSYEDKVWSCGTGDSLPLRATRREQKPEGGAEVTEAARRAQRRYSGGECEKVEGVREKRMRKTSRH